MRAGIGDLEPLAARDGAGEPGAGAASAPAFTARLRLLVFDLDGTLIDSKDDLVASVNAALRYLGRPELPGEVIAGFVGNGAPMLLQRALRATAGDDARIAESELTDGLGQLLHYYDTHKLDRTRLYPGVAELLPRLAEKFALTVLTNKPVRPAREILDGLGVAGRFQAIYGGNSFSAKKPDPVGFNAILAEQTTAPDAALMVGDSDVDVQTGRNAGAWTCGVTYGFSPNAFASAAPDWEVEAFGRLASLMNYASAAL